jgi:hypothetical protein
LWIRSYWTNAFLVFTPPDGVRVCADAFRGKVILFAYRTIPPLPHAMVKVASFPIEPDQITGLMFIDDMENVGWVGFNCELGNGSFWFSQPFWAIPLVLEGMLVFRYFSAKRKERQRVINKRCVGCGYDLRASPEHCPECGLSSTSQTQHPRRIPRTFLVLTAGSIAVGAGVGWISLRPPVPAPEERPAPLQTASTAGSMIKISDEVRALLKSYEDQGFLTIEDAKWTDQERKALNLAWEKFVLTGSPLVERIVSRFKLQRAETLIITIVWVPLNEEGKSTLPTGNGVCKIIVSVSNDLHDAKVLYDGWNTPPAN